MQEKHEQFCTLKAVSGLRIFSQNLTVSQTVGEIGTIVMKGGASIFLSSRNHALLTQAYIGPAQVVVASRTRMLASGPGMSCRASRKKLALSMTEETLLYRQKMAPHPSPLLLAAETES